MGLPQPNAHPQDGDPVDEPVDVIVEPDLLVIDVSGVDGRDGRDGTSFAGSAAPRGHHGRNAASATEPERGEDAGEVELLLTLSPHHTGTVDLGGQKVIPGRRPEAIREQISYGERGSIRLMACGGKGGNGGRGGAGEAGGKGHDGSDATRWSSGSSGGPGGDGGDGGDGTSGARGGAGGRITVQVEESDTDLLMLIQPHVNGGAGGEPGANGAGGAGGPGGEGGSAYTWTTSSVEYHTDAQGRRQPRTVSHHHRNPGGSDGPQGQRGRDGTARLAPGAPGADGLFRILVHEHGQVREYAERYEIEIVGYALELEDHFAEPTSRVVVSDVRVKNRGGMPTPATHSPGVQLAPGSWVVPDAIVLSLSHAVDPGMEYAFEGKTLTACVPELDTVPVGDPLRVLARINPLAIQSRVNRTFANRHPRQEFWVAFPGELESVVSLESQTPGRAAWLVVQVVNRSRYDLGRDSATGRFLGIRIELRNQEMAEHVMHLDLQGQQISWSTGYHEEIRHLAAGATTTIRTILGVLPGAPGYTRAEVYVTLELGQRHAPDQPRDRHQRDYPLRIAQAYEFDPTADLLLVTNHGTTTAELEAWKDAAAALRQTINVWDISLNDSLSLSDRLAHGQSLLRDLHGKTIILSNAPFQTAVGTRFGDQFLSQMDLIKAAESHGIRLLVLNDDQHELEHMFQERLIPTDGEPEYRYSSIDSFEKAAPLDDVDVLLDQVEELVRHGAQAAQPDPIRQTSEIDLYGIRAPSAKRLRRQAEALQRNLQNNAPGRRVVVMYRLPAELPVGEREKRAEQGKQRGFFFTHEHQGTLTVMPTLGDDHPNLVVLDAGAADIHDPKFIVGPRVRGALMQAMSFEEKVYLLSDKLREMGEAARIDPKSVEPGQVVTAAALVDAILVDVATEQAAVLKTPWRPLFFTGTIRKSLEQLRFLADHQFPLVTGDAQQPDVQLAARLLAGVAFLGDYSSRWYESRWFPWGFFRRGPLLRQEILNQRTKLEINLLRSPNDDQRRLIDEYYQRYVAQVDAVRRTQRLEKRSAARRVLLAPLSQSSIKTDAGRTFPGVLSYAQWETVRQAEMQREESRMALKAQKEANRAALGVAANGRPLLQTDPQLQQALQPFVEACQAARAQQEERAHELLKQREATRQRTSVTLPPLSATDPAHAEPGPRQVDVIDQRD
ncbi:MAG: DUF7932 domain-containing protein [Pirellulaceae bacterium]